MKNGKIVLIVITLFTITILLGCQGMMESTQATKAMIRSNTDEIWNSGNMDKIDEAYAANFVRHNPESWDPAVVEGPEGLKEWVTAVRTQYPDFNVNIEDIVVEGDMAATRWTVTGTDSESGKEINVKGIEITKFANGKAVEQWASWDVLTAMQQLGFVLTPPMDEGKM